MAWTKVADNGCGYKIVGDYGAHGYQPRKKLNMSDTVGNAMNRLCFMSRCCA